VMRRGLYLAMDFPGPQISSRNVRDQAGSSALH
jgi:hypothetical protein